MLAGFPSERAEVKEFGGEVSAVRPLDAGALDLELPEVLDVSKRLEDRSPQVFSEVDLSLDVIFESQPDRIVTDVARFDDRYVVANPLVEVSQLMVSTAVQYTSVAVAFARDANCRAALDDGDSTISLAA